MLLILAQTLKLFIIFIILLKYWNFQIAAFFFLKYCFIIRILIFGASLVAQWLRICLPMQGTRVQALVWEDPTCHDWAREPQLLSLRVWSLCSATREGTIVRGPRTAMKSGPRSPQLEKALAQKWRPNTAKNK